MKRTLRITLIAFGLILLTGMMAAWLLNIKYKEYSPKLLVAQPGKEANLSYFHENYEDSRHDFLAKIEKLKEKYADLKLDSFRVPSAVDDHLYMDICYLPAKDSSRLLVLSSGVHGAEGFLGTAIQSFFLDHYLEKSIGEGTSVLLLHAINPYGYKYNRRVTENNVDLNRNADVDPALFNIKNRRYADVDALINLKEKCNLESKEHNYFLFRAIFHIAIKGMKNLRQGILQGQYEYPQGLYFGGNAFETQIDVISNWIKSFFMPYDKILAIDLHTGYGERYKMHLFPNPVDEQTKGWIDKVFEGNEIDWGDQEDFYTVNGSFVDFMGKMYPQKQYIPMVFEFGTMNTSSTFGSLKSLHYSMMENQGRQYGFASTQDSIETMNAFTELFYPSEEEWRKNSLNEFDRIILPALTNFNNW